MLKETLNEMSTEGGITEDNNDQNNLNEHFDYVDGESHTDSVGEIFIIIFDLMCGVLITHLY